MRIHAAVLALGLSACASVGAPRDDSAPMFADTAEPTHTITAHDLGQFFLSFMGFAAELGTQLYIAGAQAICAP